MEHIKKDYDVVLLEQIINQVNKFVLDQNRSNCLLAIKPKNFEYNLGKRKQPDFELEYDNNIEFLFHNIINSYKDNYIKANIIDSILIYTPYKKGVIYFIEFTWNREKFHAKC